MQNSIDIVTGALCVMQNKLRQLGVPEPYNFFLGWLLRGSGGTGFGWYIFKNDGCYFLGR